MRDGGAAAASSGAGLTTPPARLLHAMVMMSANPDVHATAAALEMAAVLPKPFTVPALLRMVQRYARERATLVLQRRTRRGAIGGGQRVGLRPPLDAAWAWYAPATIVARVDPWITNDQHGRPG